MVREKGNFEIGKHFAFEHGKEKGLPAVHPLPERAEGRRGCGHENIQLLDTAFRDL